MPSCPNCGKHYNNASSVTRHLSQPRTSCLNTIHDLIQITTPSDLEPMDPDELSGYGSDSNTYPEPFGDSMDVYSSHSENLDENSQRSARSEEVADEYIGAAVGYGEGMTFMNLFDSDEFAKERESNLFYPFAGKEDWQLAHYLLASGLSMVAIDRFLSLDWVRLHLLQE